jgi:DnaJ-class molecular chaperone
MNQDPYQVLGVSPSDDETTIKKAYKKLALKHHPDRTGGDETKMKEITEAYNRIKKGDTQPGGGFYGQQRGFNADDLEDIFGGFADMFGRGGFQFNNGQPQRTKGRDIGLDMPITVREMWYGCEKLVNINGNTISINVPAGIRHGAKIRYQGHGLPGSMGGNGDLIITVVIQKDNKYSIEGNNVYANQEITVWDAIVGGDIEYTHVDDRLIKISIRPGTQNGQMYRLPGYGINNGDLMVRCFIKIPEILTKEQKSVILKWQKGKK